MEGLSIPRLARLQLHLPTYKDGTDPQTTPQRGRTPGLLPPQTELIHGLLHRRERPRGSATEGTDPQAPPHPEMVTEKLKKKWIVVLSLSQVAVGTETFSHVSITLR